MTPTSSFGPSFGDHLNQLKPQRHRRVKSLRPQATATMNWHWRILPLICVFIGCMVLLAGRLWQLQIVEGQQQRALSESNSYALEVVPAPRGTIYDRQDVVLARNEPTFRVALTASNWPTETDARNQQVATLAKVLKMPESEIQQRLDEAKVAPFFPVTLKTNVDRDTEVAVLTVKDQLPGVTIGQDLRRSYPLGPSMSHLIGYTGSISQADLDDPLMADYHPGESIGQAGLEQTYQTDLHGIIGQRFSQVNAQGQPTDRQTEVAPKSGLNLHLSIDSQLQQYVYDVLTEAMNKYATTGAAAIVQDPKTGQILSQVSLPSYDDNLFAQGISSSDYSQLMNQPLKPMFDRTIAGTYPPGSTVKPLVAAAAVDEGVIKPDSLVNCASFITVGTFRYADWTFWLGRGAPGPMNAVKAIAQSCDTYFYQVGGGYESQKGLGVNTLHRYFSQAGFGALTGIDLPGEAKGVSPDPAWKQTKFPDDPGWYVGNTYQLAIGQSYLLATPMQVNNVTSAIANGGKLLKPQLVDHLTNEQGQLIRKVQPQVIRASIAEPAGLAVAREGMHQAVDNGIIFPLRGNPMRAAAKTGTAEFGTKNAKGEYQTHSWVTGYAPFDQPKLSFTILLESGGSSTNAAEVADKILKWYNEHEPK